jgi:hypothetical protein
MRAETPGPNQISQESYEQDDIAISESEPEKIRNIAPRQADT